MQIAVASFNDGQAQTARELVGALGPEDVSIHVNRTPELIHAADCCLACSGSVSLELMYYGKPAVIHYEYRSPGLRAARSLSHSAVDHTGEFARGHSIARKPCEDLDGASARPFPEFLTYQDESQAMAAAVVERLQDADLRAAIERQLSQLCDAYGQPGASHRAAVYLSEHLGSLSSPARRPHFENRHAASANRVTK